MLPSLAEEAPGGADWIHEIKHDGFRTLLVVDRGITTAWTRGENDWTTRYPAIVAAASSLDRHSAVIDGEVIVQEDTVPAKNHNTCLDVADREDFVRHLMQGINVNGISVWRP